jgi:hypothetical protein
VLRRIWHIVVDLLDGILAGMLYGHQGGLGWYSGSAESQNARKLRQWSASGGSRTTTTEPMRQRTESQTDFDERMRRFRRDTSRPSED